MKSSLPILAGLFLLVLTAMAGPVHADRAASFAGGAPMILPVDPEPLVVETRGGERTFTIEAAREPAEQARGLMFREEMDDDHGMLFVFEATRHASFWMKNTPLALDLLFIGEDGVIRAILPGEPFSTAPIEPGEPVRFVLELKAGTAQSNGIAAGDRVRHRLLSPP